MEANLLQIIGIHKIAKNWFFLQRTRSQLQLKLRRLRNQLELENPTPEQMRMIDHLKHSIKHCDRLLNQRAFRSRKKGEVVNLNPFL